jgi:hypothetical protein
LALPDQPPFDPDYDASEYEPYTDADCWRSLFEAVHQADADLDERMRRASCLMLRCVAPLVASLDKLKYLPIDTEEHPYLTPAGHAHAAAASVPKRSEEAASPGQPWVVQDADADDLDVEALAAAYMLPDDEAEAVEHLDVEHLDSGSESDYSDVATPVEAQERVPKGAELRVVAKVVELGGVTTLHVPKEPGSVREHLH